MGTRSRRRCELSREVGLPAACWCKNSDYPRRVICTDITEYPYRVVATRNRVRRVETRSVISGSKLPRGCCDVDREHARMRGDLIAKQVKIAASDAFSDSIQSVR
jgi:hypothetical protein